MENPHIHSKEKIQTENLGLVREISSKGLLSIDRRALETHRLKVKRVKEQQKSVDEINTLKEQISNIEGDIQEIKQLLLLQFQTKKDE
jgi:TolA-binding protein